MAKPGAGDKRPLEQPVLGHADHPAPLAEAFPDQGDHHRALHEYGQRHQDHEHENLLQAGEYRAAEADGDDADGKNDVDRQGLQDAAGAAPPDIARPQQASPQVRPASDGDAAFRLGMLEAVFAQCHDPYPLLFPTPERVAKARRRVDRTAYPTYIFRM